MAEKDLKQNSREDILKALENREFVPYFQPQYDYAQKKVIGAEVLARWQKPDGSVLVPASFIPVLEESEAIICLDYMILEKGVKLLATWQQEGMQLPHTSFNLSRRTLMDENLVTRIKEIFDRYHFDTSLCHLEVTESAYIRNNNDIFDSVRALKEMSFIVEMDDFGSGYSSLGFLRNAPVDVLKLDMSFLQMDENRGKGGSIISAIVRLAGNLNMQIIAEGVETLEQAEFLKSVGCYWMQGYYFAKPMCAEQYRQELLVNGISVPDMDAFHEINKAVDSLDDTTQSALLFNSFVGGAMILEYKNGECYPVRANDRLFKILGLDGEEIPFQCLGPELLEPESRKRFLSMLEEAIGSQTEAECEVCTLLEKNGIRPWFHLRTRCIAKKKNGAYIFYLTLDDITERKQLDRENADLASEQELLQSKLEVSSTELKNAIRSVKGGTALYELNKDGTIKLIKISREAAAIPGYTPEEYAKEFSRDPYFCTYEADKERVQQKVEACFGEGSDFESVYRVVHKNGGVIWVRLKGTLTKTSSDNRQLYAFFTNLSANLDNFNALINEADTAVVVTDLASHEILYANRKAAELGGITPEQALGRPCYKCLNQCSTIDQKCMEEIPPEGLELDEVREGRVYRVRRKKMNWNGIEASVCYINDRTDTVSLENQLVDHPTIHATVLKQAREILDERFSNEAVGDQKEKWENILSIILKRKTDYQDILTDDNLRIRIQFVAVFALMSIVAIFMTALNLVQGMWKLAATTGIFALLSILNIVFALSNEKTEKLSYFLFGVEIIALFTVFAITGNPEGFSILWSVLLPTLGMILYRRKIGILLSAVMWLILVFLFWTPLGRSLLQYQYTATFMTRFPILYTALGGMGVLFEYIRKTTQDELVSLRKRFEHLYNHDALTGLFNRYGFNSTIESITKWKEHGNMAFAIMDLDSFKSVNDTYGHMNGDKVLKITAQNIQEVVGDHGVVSRWGGEEFSVLFYQADEAEELCEKILQVCRDQEYVFDGQTIHVTVSIGLVKFEGFSLGGSTDVITQADNNLYTSKQNGKDRMTVTDLRTGTSPQSSEE